MRKFTVLLLFALLALFAGCHTPSATGTYNTTIGGHTLQSVEKSILEALHDLEWSARKIDHQTIEATLFVQKSLFSKYNEHILTVLISYTPQEYSIRYKSSVNLEYDIENNTIDARYDMWVDELNQRIQERLYRTQNEMINGYSRVYVEEAPAEQIVIVEPALPAAAEPVPTRTLTTERVVVVEPPPVKADTAQKAPDQTN